MSLEAGERDRNAFAPSNFEGGRAPAGSSVNFLLLLLGVRFDA